MEQTVNQANQTPEKTFTQAEVNKIVEERLLRDRQKFGDYEALKAKAAKFDEMEEAAKSELQKATERASTLQQELESLKKEGELRIMRERIAKESGVPATLLTSDTEEGCKAQAKELIEFAKPSYPNVRDAGEANATGKTTTRDSFAKWWEATVK